VTIHKSQGLTFEHAILDLSDSFAPGQMYVALSRLTSLKGLILATRIPETIIPKDPSLENFERSKTTDDELVNELTAKSHQYLHEFITLTYNLDDTKELFMNQIRSFKDLGAKSAKKAYQSNINEWTDQLTELSDVGFKFGRQMAQLLLTEITAEDLLQRVEKAQSYFEPKLATLAEAIQNSRASAAKIKGMKAFSKELKELSQQVINHLKEIKKAAPLTAYILKGNEPGEFDFSDLKKLDSGKEDDKTPSKNISLELYKTGKTSFEIAEERQMAQSTIEGHLASFVDSGEVNAMDFTTQEVKEKVGKLVAQKKLTLSELKQLLPDSVTYTQIRFAQEALK
jgi:ATP-dependent exoDNAse (exonuclease V) alpha subunit